MPPIKNLGYEVEFTELWPLMVGGLLSAAIAVAVFMGWRIFPLYVMIAMIGVPLACAHLYIKKIIENAPPHKEVYWAVATIWSKGLHFRQTGTWWRIVLPVVYRKDAIANTPPTSDCRPPLLRLITRIKDANIARAK